MSSVRKIIDRGCRTPPTFHHLIAASLGKHYPLMDTDPGKPWLGGLAWAWDFEARSPSPRKPAFWLGLACEALAWYHGLLASSPSLHITNGGTAGFDSLRPHYL
ncbi:hypothetical protein C8F04DRAFT_1182594 [Mycena alexandri]|uniref:Uncharacterized protein n=1 Tax=Mycena alexandri TaxID=1745969 RepID=A0AAD6X7P5_9AGAR|nr:hypothetical protein C8F04DRAFT_1182594 [Mycena alexandri]